jgi:chaperonin GroES
VNARLNRQWQ